MGQGMAYLLTIVVPKSGCARESSGSSLKEKKNARVLFHPSRVRISGSGVCSLVLGTASTVSTYVLPGLGRCLVLGGICNTELEITA